MIQNPHRDFPIVTPQRLGENEFIGWMQSVTELLNKLEIIDGTVNPNGSVFASPKKLYFNSALGELWFKTTAATVNTGWVELT
jgi:hypothetical protein